MAKGKWAQGIKPRAFQWVIQDQLAVCERPGGYGTNHRKVRRQEEIIWIRENGFAFVVSLIPSDHNLHAYDEFAMPWKHWPFAPGLDLDLALPQIYTELQTLLGGRKKLLLHMEEINDRLMGLMAGYLRWTEMVPVTHEAIVVAERIFGRQIGPEGRAIADAAATAPKTVPPRRRSPDDGAGAAADGGSSGDAAVAGQAS
ncbi:MAG: hypothetical protein OEW83_06285 [Acidimicrobiia bacterium]|nr:hypothetical protein [Acidimicrobiia bacterium]